MRIFLACNDRDLVPIYTKYIWEMGAQCTTEEPDHCDALFLGAGWQKDRVCVVTKGYFSTKYPTRPIFFDIPTLRDWVWHERERRSLEDFRTTKQGEQTELPL